MGSKAGHHGPRSKPSPEQLRALYGEIPKSAWFKRAYEGKSLGDGGDDLRSRGVRMWATRDGGVTECFLDRAAAEYPGILGEAFFWDKDWPGPPIAPGECIEVIVTITGVTNESK